MDVQEQLAQAGVQARAASNALRSMTCAVKNAAVCIYGWHADRIYPATLDNLPEIVRFAASDAMARIVPKVVTWLDEGQPKLKKFLENK